MVTLTVKPEHGKVGRVLIAVCLSLLPTATLTTPFSQFTASHCLRSGPFNQVLIAVQTAGKRQEVRVQMVGGYDTRGGNRGVATIYVQHGAVLVISVAIYIFRNTAATTNNLEHIGR